MAAPSCPVPRRRDTRPDDPLPVGAARTERLLILALVIVAVLAVWASAQTVGVEQRVDTDPPGVASSTQPQLVTTQDGTAHVVWQDYRHPRWVVYHRRGETSGTTWTTPETPLSPVTSPPAPGPDATRPVIATDGGLALYVAWHATSSVGLETIGFTRSIDGGLSWEPPRVLTDVATGVGVVSEYAGPPHLVADDAGRVHVTWAQSDGQRDQVYHAVSHDRGATFHVPPITQPVNVVLLGHSESPRVATDGAGHVYLAWLDHRDPPHRDVWLRRSVDGGLSWEPGETRLSGHGIHIELELVAHAPAGVAGPHRVLAAWIALLDDGQGVPFTRVESRYSTDGGLAWQPLEGAVSDTHPSTAGSAPPTAGPAAGGPPTPGGGPGGAGSASFRSGRGGASVASGLPTFETARDIAFHLDLVVDEVGAVHAVHGRVDHPLVGQPVRVVHNRLDPATGVWGVERRLSRGGSPYPEKGLPTFARPAVAAHGDAVFVAWSAAEPGSGTRTEIWGTLSGDGGATFAPAVRLSADPAGPGLARSAYPRVAATAAGAVVVWDDRRAWTDHTVLPLPPGSPVGTPDVYVTTLSP